MAHSVRLRSAQTALEGVTILRNRAELIGCRCVRRGSVAPNFEKTWRRLGFFGALTIAGLRAKDACG